MRERQFPARDPVRFAVEDRAKQARGSKEQGNTAGVLAGRKVTPPYEYKKNRKNTVKMRLRGLLFLCKKIACRSGIDNKDKLLYLLIFIWLNSAFKSI